MHNELRIKVQNDWHDVGLISCSTFLVVANYFNILFKNNFKILKMAIGYR